MRLWQMVSGLKRSSKYEAKRLEHSYTEEEVNDLFETFKMQAAHFARFLLIETHSHEASTDFLLPYKKQLT